MSYIHCYVALIIMENILNQHIIVQISIVGLLLCFIAATILMVLWHKSDKRMKKLLK